MSVREVAAEARVSPGFIRQIERGYRPVPIKRIKDFARGYGLGKNDTDVLAQEIVADFERRVKNEIPD